MVEVHVLLVIVLLVEIEPGKETLDQNVRVKSVQAVDTPFFMELN